MITRILDSRCTWISGVISAMCLPGIALLMAIGSCCIPLPSEMIMPFAGWLVATGRFSLWGIALAGAIGCVLGSIPAYYAGMYGGRAPVQRYGRDFFMNTGHLHRAERVFAPPGEITVPIAPLLPAARTLIAFPPRVAPLALGQVLLF